MNTIILLGRLVRDPEVRITPSGKTICKFTLAVSRAFSRQGGEKETDFIKIVMWDKLAELYGNSLAKGHRVLVEGRLQIRNYVDTNGEKKYITEVVANHADFIEHRDKGNETKEEEAKEELHGMETFGKVLPFDDGKEIPF